MAAPHQSDCRNRLLALMSEADYARVAPGLEWLKLTKGVILIEADGPIDHVYFPERGIISIVAASPEGHEVEAGLLGREGLGPVEAVMGSDRAPNKVMVQVEGEGFRMEREAFARALAESPSFHAFALRYVQTWMVQSTFTSLSNAVHPIDERLARWLLMCHDRSDSDEIALTHEFMSVMLSVRRPSVTTSLHVLEGNCFIRSERGYVVIRNRKALEEFAGDTYGRPEAEYRRLIGPMS